MLNYIGVYIRFCILRSDHHVVVNVNVRGDRNYPSEILQLDNVTAVLLCGI